MLRCSKYSVRSFTDVCVRRKRLIVSRNSSGGDLAPPGWEGYSEKGGVCSELFSEAVQLFLSSFVQLATQKHNSVCTHRTCCCFMSLLASCFMCPLLHISTRFRLLVCDVIGRNNTSHWFITGIGCTSSLLVRVS